MSSALCEFCRGTGTIVDRRTFKRVEHAYCNGTGFAPRGLKKPPKLAHRHGSKRRPVAIASAT